MKKSEITTADRKQKRRSGKKRIVLWSVLGVLALALLAAGIYVWHVLKRPDVFFDSSVRVSANLTPEPTPLFDIDAYLPTDEPGTTPIPTAIPAGPTATPAIVTEDPAADQPAATEPVPEKLGIVNIALFGIDAYENGTSTSGSMPHTDANLIVAVNFDTKEVSLISIARDCLTIAPGYTGYYKFNGVFNVGGGMKDPKAGLELSCRAAEEWLGGVSVPYYYGVDFQALIDLVDQIGGIDFQVDIRLKTLDGKVIEKGFRHLDGQGVMAYMRMRKSAGGLDSKRTARQRKMLVAIFGKLKKEGKLSMIPDLMKTMGDNVYTNTTLSQTVSLVNFAKDIDPESIKSYSIQGTMHMKYDWAFCFIDQQARIDILKEVYGIDAAPIGYNSTEYEKFLHHDGFKAILYLNITKKLFAAVHERAEKEPMSETQKAAYAQCWKDQSDLQSVFGLADDWMQAHYDGNASEEDTLQLEAYLESMHKLEAKLRASANALNDAFGKPIKARWDYNTEYWSDKGSEINEVYVDFR